MALSAVVWVGVVGAVTLPSPIVTPDTGVDTSGAAGLVLAATHGLTWGKHIAWTYGPLGYLHFPYFFLFRQWVLFLIVSVTVHVALIITFGWLLWKSGRGPVVWLIAGLVLTLPSSAIGYLVSEGTILGVLWFYAAAALVQSRHLRMALTIGAAVILDCIALVKATGLVQGAAEVGVYVVLAIYLGRRCEALTALTSFCGALIGLWALSGETANDVGPYLIETYQFVTGYSTAVLAGPVDRFDVLSAGVLVLGVVATGWALRRRRTSALVLLALCLPVTAVYYREGFGHPEEFISVIVVLLIAILIDALRTERNHNSAWRLSTPVAAVMALLVGWSLPVGTLPLTHFSATMSAYRSALSVLTGPGVGAALEKTGAAQLRNDYRLSDAMVSELQQGTVDVIPWDIGVIYAYNLRWNPRPVLQSYGAYTTYLDGLDAGHLTGSQAPDRVLYRFETIGGRYAFFDEPTAYRALLDNYEPVSDVVNGFVVLAQRAVPVHVTSHFEGRHCSTMGQTIEVPRVTDRRVYAEIDMNMTVRGRLDSLFLRPARVNISFDAERIGRSPSYQLVPNVARDGVLVSNYLNSTDDVVRLMRGLAVPTITGLRVTADGAGDYRDMVCASFFSIDSLDRPG